MQSLNRLTFVCFILTITTSASFAVTIINLPPDDAPTSIGADTIVNVLPGGVLSYRKTIQATDGAIVNVLGGEVGSLSLRNSAVVNVEVNSVSNYYSSRDGGIIYHHGGKTAGIGVSSYGFAEIDGGSIASIGTSNNSELIINGVNFSVDGVLVPGLENVGDTVSLNLDEDSVFTMLFADGTSFGHAEGIGGSRISRGMLTLRRSAPPLYRHQARPSLTPSTPLPLPGMAKFYRSSKMVTFKTSSMLVLEVVLS